MFFNLVCQFVMFHAGYRDPAGELNVQRRKSDVADGMYRRSEDVIRLRLGTDQGRAVAYYTPVLQSPYRESRR